MSKQRYYLELAYDGNGFCGWQRQKQENSIQANLEECISTILKQQTHLTASGRTDAGVHALKQVAHFDYSENLDDYRFLKALNGLTHHNIQIKKILAVDESFHARYSAKAKTYHYHVWTDRFPSPFLKGYRYHHKGPLSIEVLQQAIPYFIGEKNFSSFSNSQNEGACKKNPIRNLYRLDFKEQEGGFRLELESNGFLYKMVRNIVGTLIDVSRGRLELSDIEKILKAKDRKLAGKAAAAHGLFLYDVSYDLEKVT
jgi:tRNA pseudouridine38-40 synthase